MATEILTNPEFPSIEILIKNIIDFEARQYQTSISLKNCYKKIGNEKVENGNKFTLFLKKIVAEIKLMLTKSNNSLPKSVYAYVSGLVEETIKNKWVEKYGK